MSKIRSFPHYEINVKDESIRYPFIPEELSLHIPLWFLFTEKGEVNKPFYGSYDEIKKKFGERTFDELYPYFKHSTVFTKENLKFQKAMINRLEPPESEAASMVLECAVYQSDIHQWEKDEDPSSNTYLFRLTDGNGDWIPKLDPGTGLPIEEPGYILQWRRRILGLTESLNSLTSYTEIDGGITKTIYPIFSYKMKYPGISGNNTAIKIFFNKNDYDENITNMIQALTFGFGIINKDMKTGYTSPVMTKYSNDIIDVALKPNSININNNMPLSYKDAIDFNYEDNEFDTYLYSDNVKTIGDLCLIVENSNTFPKIINNPWMINIIDGLYVDGRFYDHIIVNSDDTYQSYLYYTLFYLPGDVILNDNINPDDNIGLSQYLDLDTPLNPYDNKSPLNEFVVNYLFGGMDGDLSNSAFESKVRNFLQLGVFPDIQDEARYPITHLYDSGYSIETKNQLINFAGIRDDIKIVLSTQDINEEINSKADDISIGTALLNKCKLINESSYFGTQACRFSIFMQCGKLTNNTYIKTVPATIDCMIKKAYWHGATYIKGEPKGLPFSQVLILKNINWLPTTDEIKQLSWDAGLNYMQYYDMTSFHYPSTKSIYANDTSLLSDDLFVDYLIYLKHIVREEWAKYAGISSNISKQVGTITKSLNKQIYNTFRNYIRIEVSIYQTEQDKLLGYQLTVKIAVYDTPSNRVWHTIMPIRREEK